MTDRSAIFDELHEECGVFGVFGVPDAASLAYYGLHNLQHRGQEGCGIATFDDGKLHHVKGLGLVSEVFTKEKLETLAGPTAIGHVRYSTAGGGGINNVQPFVFHHYTGDFALAHNGNIVNSHQLRRFLEEKGSLFHSTSDSEILAHLIKKSTAESLRIDAIKEALNMIEGAFAFVIMTPNRIYACRDKYGLRPLSLGRLNDGWVVSSETCAFDVVGAEFVRDIAPGEIVSIDRNGIRTNDYSQYKRCKMCAMEYIYFARPDSDIEGCNVHAFRKESGRLLWQEAPADADIVVGVPDSSLSAAMGYAEAGGEDEAVGREEHRERQEGSAHRRFDRARHHLETHRGHAARSGSRGRARAHSESPDHPSVFLRSGHIDLRRADVRAQEYGGGASRDRSRLVGFHLRKGVVRIRRVAYRPLSGMLQRQLSDGLVPIARRSEQGRKILSERARTRGRGGGEPRARDRF